MNLIENAVCEVKKGNLVQYEIIISTYQQQLFRYCHHMLCNLQDAEDIVQDTFVKAYQNLASYKENISFSAWLYKIAYNNCINLIRRRKLVKFIPFLEATVDETVEFESSIVEAEYSKELNLALGHLSPLDRSLMVLRVQEELGFEEISVILAAKPEALRKRYERARKKLKEILETSKEVF